MITSRRKFLIGMGTMLAAPAIVHAGNLMPIKALPFELPSYGISPGLQALYDLQYLDILHRRMVDKFHIDLHHLEPRPDYADVKFVPMPWAVPR